MNSRIQLVVDEEEKERFRREAAREGKSLSAWLREAARSRMARRSAPRLDTVEELRAFFEACDERETEPEPDWREHRRVIEGSARSGAAET
ncbi:MAG: ribbon-helix-helix protein, CopG family [Gemmatimonadota bacterium]